jgi:hypothetical protein
MFGRVKASEAILTPKRVTFCYKQEIDADRTPQFGLVAEEVEKGESRLSGSRALSSCRVELSPGQRLTHLTPQP